MWKWNVGSDKWNYIKWEWKVCVGSGKWEWKVGVWSGIGANPKGVYIFCIFSTFQLYFLLSLPTFYTQFLLLFSTLTSYTPFPISLPNFHFLLSFSVSFFYLVKLIWYNITIIRIISYLNVYSFNISTNISIRTLWKTGVEKLQNQSPDLYNWGPGSNKKSITVMSHEY